ncbi:MAG: SDR family NAD(P)-dependent oxidoreductase [Betaproteobacteria bacterium]
MSNPALRTAIVTGVSRGLGEALALALLRRGFHVTGVGRGTSARLAGERYRFVACDLADVAGIDAALSAPFTAIAALRPASACLVNNAALAGTVGVYGTHASADFVGPLAVNLAAPAALANLFCRVFAAMAGDRRIVNVSSGSAARVLPGFGYYSVAKAGLEMLTAGIAAEQGAQGIRAISLRPGIIATDMQREARSHSEAAFPSVGVFRDFHEKGLLVEPDAAADRIATFAIEAPVEQGRVYSYAELGA